MIDRKALVRKQNPVLSEMQPLAPLSVGNGNLCFTADVTGMQSLSEDYEKAGFPLLTMSGWGWHEEPDGEGKTYCLDDVAKTEYICGGRSVSYAVEKKPGNEKVYDWVRENPHRFNLVRIGLIKDGKHLEPAELRDIHQELDLYSGCLQSKISVFVEGEKERIITQSVCHGEEDVLGFSISVGEKLAGRIQIEIAFPYPSWKIQGADWTVPQKHDTVFEVKDDGICLWKRQMDAFAWKMAIYGCKAGQVVRADKHRFLILPGSDGKIEFSLEFEKEDERISGENSKKEAAMEIISQEKSGKVKGEEQKFTNQKHGKIEAGKKITFGECRESAAAFWENFWERGGMISFEGSSDKRARELERRMILSLYLSRLNSCGVMPPQETGLTVNSWYGKSHLEMHFWHQAYLPLWGRGELLKPSLKWYKEILPKAKENAARNGYRGAKWPKMVGPEGVDSPSEIATLLVWQQPHILYLLELLYRTESSPDSLLEEYWEVVFETAEYLADFPVFDAEKDCYDLVAPLIPAQECHKPMDTKNPVYEVEYWRFGLKIAIVWAKRMGKQAPAKWREVCDKMAKPAVRNGVYPAHENCPDTFTRFAKDHPSMTAASGVLPGERIDRGIMRNTLQEVEKSWDYGSMWGWDFAMMAMSYARLFDGENAVNTLLSDTPKNSYGINGHNIQPGRRDLPVYLPGNGSFLLALALMAAGFEGCDREFPGFPHDDAFRVEVEGIYPFPE